MEQLAVCPAVSNTEQRHYWIFDFFPEDAARNNLRGPSIVTELFTVQKLQNLESCSVNGNICPEKELALQEGLQCAALPVEILNVSGGFALKVARNFIRGISISFHEEDSQGYYVIDSKWSAEFASKSR